MVSVEGLEKMLWRDLQNAKNDRAGLVQRPEFRSAFTSSGNGDVSARVKSQDRPGIHERSPF